MADINVKLDDLTAVDFTAPGLDSIPKSWFWSWYKDNQNKTILEVKILMFNLKKFKLRQLRPLFEFVFGPRPW